MMRYQIEPGESEVLRLQAPDVSYTSLYPQITIKNSSGVTIETVDLTHDANGLYTYLWTANVAEGKYYTQGLFYTDSGHTTLADIIQPDSDSIDICHYKFRPSFGGGGQTVINDNNNLLVDLEDRLKEYIKELFESRTEFNPKTDIVNIDFSPFKNLEKSFLLRLGQLENSIPKVNDNTNSINKIIKLLSDNFTKINDIVKKIDSSSTQSLSDIKKQINIFDDLSKEISLVNQTIKTNSDIKVEFTKVANIVKDINDLVKQMETIKSDINLGFDKNSKDFSETIRKVNDQIVVAAKSINIDSLVSLLDNSYDDLKDKVEEIKELLVKKDKIDFERISVLLNEIRKNKVFNFSNNNSDSKLTSALEYMLSNSSNSYD